MNKAWLSFVFVALLCALAVGQNNFKVLHSFSGYPNDGAHPVSDVVFDKVGNLYGVTLGGGSGFGCGDNGCGSVFELSPNKDGSWTEQVLYNFCSNYNGQQCLDGEAPVAGLVLDAVGNLYGTTSGGGTQDGCSLGGCGTVFQLSPPKLSGESWSERVLYSFCSNYKGEACIDGLGPESQLIFDAAGNLYGTTAAGGRGHINQAGEVGGGVVFELSPKTDGWSESVLYNFCSLGHGNSCPDGLIPNGGVIFDAAGNLHGTTDYSGVNGAGVGGTVYEIFRGSEGWTYKLLLDIPQNSKQSIIQSPISFDTAGNLYGTFSAPYGGVFQMNPTTRKLSLFSFNGTDGLDPIGGVYVDSRVAAVYGTTSGSAAGPGNIFKLAVNGKETVLHKFCSWENCTDGEIPWSTLIPDSARDFYGTTEFGGAYGAGVVFEIIP
jgi:uncharacterized repeat protein (TIGR03803 family)